ncbi:MAG: hypothetical protein N2383_06550 [Caldilineales bacterium]|nr:hypothetical protein [Caldilineales bacterium]
MVSLFVVLLVIIALYTWTLVVETHTETSGRSPAKRHDSDRGQPLL